jgi:hypothetical protein
MALAISSGTGRDLASATGQDTNMPAGSSAA